MDRRETPFNGKVAHISLQGKVDAPRFAEGETHYVTAVVTDLCTRPQGPRDRQLILGEAFRVLDLNDGWAFGFAQRDGYVGWIEAAALVGGIDSDPTHYVCVPRSYGKSTPELKVTEHITYLPFGARLHLESQKNSWSKVRFSRGAIPRDLHVPSQHLREISQSFDDPVEVTRLLLGTPYLWGGNSAFGIDCSGLIQTAMLACGIPCPGDSDQQADRLGRALTSSDQPERGDLVFWKGHVGTLSDAETLLHANAYHMAVVEEPLAEAISRIKSKEGSDPSFRRIT